MAAPNPDSSGNQDDYQKTEVLRSLGNFQSTDSEKNPLWENPRIKKGTVVNIMGDLRHMLAQCSIRLTRDESSISDICSEIDDTLDTIEFLSGDEDPKGVKEIKRIVEAERARIRGNSPTSPDTAPETSTHVPVGPMTPDHPLIEKFKKAQDRLGKTTMARRIFDYIAAQSQDAVTASPEIAEATDEITSSISSITTIYLTPNGKLFRTAPFFVKKTPIEGDKRKLSYKLYYDPSLDDDDNDDPNNEEESTEDSPEELTPPKNAVDTPLFRGHPLFDKFHDFIKALPNGSTTQKKILQTLAQRKKSETIDSTILGIRAATKATSVEKCVSTDLIASRPFYVNTIKKGQQEYYFLCYEETKKQDNPENAPVLPNNVVDTPIEDEGHPLYKEFRDFLSKFAQNATTQLGMFQTLASREQNEKMNAEVLADEIGSTPTGIHAIVLNRLSRLSPFYIDFVEENGENYYYLCYRKEGKALEGPENIPPPPNEVDTPIEEGHPLQKDFQKEIQRLESIGTKVEKNKIKVLQRLAQRKPDEYLYGAGIAEELGLTPAITSLTANSLTDSRPFYVGKVKTGKRTYLFLCYEAVEDDDDEDNDYEDEDNNHPPSAPPKLDQKKVSQWIAKITDPDAKTLAEHFKYTSTHSMTDKDTLINVLFEGDSAAFSKAVRALSHTYPFYIERFRDEEKYQTYELASTEENLAAWANRSPGGSKRLAKGLEKEAIEQGKLGFNVSEDFVFGLISDEVTTKGAAKTLKESCPGFILAEDRGKGSGFIFISGITKS